jgi:RHS repeat-associated protein
LIEQDLPTGAKRTYSYVSFERTLQDADLAPVHSVLDGQGRPTLTERLLPDGTHEIVQATYDPAGRLLTTTLAGGLVTRSFTYDTLGRLTQSSDPDLGTRVLTWDDGNRLRTETNAAGQTITYTYDSLGRLSTRDTGSHYAYHYDTARPGASNATNLAGQVAWVEEPTGTIDFGYDELGRQTFTRRIIDGQSSEQTKSLAASGLLLGQTYDDGFGVTFSYDPAGRVTGAADLWSVIDQDAAGNIKEERTSTGVDTLYQRDVLGLPSEVKITDVDGKVIYDVSATRDLRTEIKTETDLDGDGLDHTATFTYDAFARLTGATMGTGATMLTFGYGYDVLHNMTSRTAPSTVAAFTGTYRYGESGHAPRQLTSIADAAGNVLHTFAYDAAGRQTAEDGRTMTYDAADRLLSVAGLPGGAVSHAYGQDGNRVKTVEPDGSVSYFFGDGTAIRNGVREHDVTVGARVIARVAMTAGSDGGDGPGGPAGGGIAGLLSGGTLWTLGGCALMAAVAWMMMTSRSRTRRRAATAVLVTIVASACSGPGLGAHRAASTIPTPTFLHSSFYAGPAVYTDGAGHALEERRYEPFGEPIDARVAGVVSSPNVHARDLNSLNKRTDLATGWSDHGARWMMPETARWTSPDPLVESPGADLMGAPWALHPYQYVDQNPIQFWDPDGRQPARSAVEESSHSIVVTEYDVFAMAFNTIRDLDTGKVYEGAGVTSPSIGVTSYAGIVRPFSGHTAEDVILGWGIGVTVGLPGSGPTVSVSGNDSGVIVLGGVQLGTGGAGASFTYTTPQMSMKERHEQLLLAQKRDTHDALNFLRVKAARERYDVVDCPTVPNAANQVPADWLVAQYQRNGGDLIEGTDLAPVACPGSIGPQPLPREATP